LLQHIAETSLFEALEAGVFADIKRLRNGGKGLDGVFPKDRDYWNPAMDRLKEGRYER